jgi:hypothetical protein
MLRGLFVSCGESALPPAVLSEGLCLFVLPSLCSQVVLSAHAEFGREMSHCTKLVPMVVFDIGSTCCGGAAYVSASVCVPWHLWWTYRAAVWAYLLRSQTYRSDCTHALHCDPL